MKFVLKSKYGIIVNHKKLYKLMKTHNLQSIIRRKRNYFSIKNKEKLTSPNVLNREFNARRIGEKYVTDITYIPISTGMIYLSAVIDLYNNEVITYNLSAKQDASLSLTTLNLLKEKRNISKSIIHSDQGIHYTNKEFVNTVRAHNAIQSMSRRGNCWDNAVMESFFGSFKCERLNLRKKLHKTLDDVKEIVEEYIFFYNNERPQKKLKGLAPIQYRSQ